MPDRPAAAVIMDADALIARAEQRAGVADSDAFVRGNLERLLQALEATAGLSDEGWEGAERALLMDTVNRLEGLSWVRDHPEIARLPVEQPVFIMGLPRSGTTYLQYLFDLDPRFRQLRTWEALAPSPPPGADPESALLRRAEWAERRRRMAPAVPGFEALHLHDEGGPEECHALLEQTFGAAGLNNLYRVPDYFDYLLSEADLEASYRVHRRQLQLLQWQSPPRPWVLKYPNHVLAIPQLLRVYPDARLVMTHRDPVRTLASIANLTARLRAPRCGGAVDRADVGRHMRWFIRRHIDRILAAVDGPAGDRILHVDYYALVDEPAAVMRGIHAGLGIESPAQVLGDVAAWRQANPPHARGANPYSAAGFGLDEDELAEEFADYSERFDVPREGERLNREPA